MALKKFGQDSANNILEICSSYPVFCSLALVICLCALHRVWSGYRYRQSQKRDVPKEPGMLPHWLPFIGHGLSYILDNAAFLSKARDQSRDGVFAIRLAGYKHYQIIVPSLVKEVFAQRKTVLTNQRLVNWLAKNAFHDDGITATAPVEELYPQISSNLHLLMTEAAITEASDRTSTLVGSSIRNLVSFIPDPRLQKPWERSANVGFPTTVEKYAVAEAELFRLITRWAFSCSTPTIFGSAFLEKFPSLMDDVYIFDDQIPMLITGLPALNRKMKVARDALDRASKAIEEWFDTLSGIEDGREAGSVWGDMKDVSELARIQHRTWRRGGEQVKKAAIANLLSLFWGLHTNSNIIAFWTIVNIYSSPELLASIRAEATPYVAESSILGQYTIDHTSLSRQCPMLKASWLETMRRDVIGVEMKYILQDFSITESPSDAALLRGLGASPRTYNLKAGNVVCVHNGSSQSDPRLWDNPKEFNPSRFVVKDSRNENREKAEMPRHLYSFGGGYSMCKGRIFAEREVLGFVAAVVCCWDMEYLGEKTKDGSWVVEKAMDAGSPHPGHEVTVRLRRRKVDTL